MGTMTDNEKRIFWIDFVNDFLTIDGYAEYHNMDLDECTRLLSEGKRLYNDGEPAYNDSQDLERAKRIKNLFLIYFDGCYGIDSVENTSNTFAMGVCKLDYKDNVLTVHLRRPGLLIGKGGCIIDALAKHLECKIDIVEVNLLK